MGFTMKKTKNLNEAGVGTLYRTGKRTAKLILPIITALMLTACFPDKEAPALLSEGETSPARDSYFDALWQGRYSQLNTLIPALKQEADAGDEKSMAILGFAYAWQLAEYRRDPAANPTVGNNARLAVEAFDSAMDEIPNDARLLGFRGSFKQAQARVEDNPSLTIAGFLDEEAAAKRWPAWGLFTKAYGVITLSPSDKIYQGGIDAMWKNLDVCAGTKVDRNNFAIADYPNLFTQNSDPRIQRACTNTPVAPHNIEGFFLYFGDLYAKANELEKAQHMYQIALDMNPGDWPYAQVAMTRIERLNQLPELFNTEYDRALPVSVDDINLFQGPANCMACHQGSAL